RQRRQPLRRVDVGAGDRRDHPVGLTDLTGAATGQQHHDGGWHGEQRGDDRARHLSPPRRQPDKPRYSLVVPSSRPATDPHPRLINDGRFRPISALVTALDRPVFIQMRRPAASRRRTSSTATTRTDRKGAREAEWRLVTYPPIPRTTTALAKVPMLAHDGGPGGPNARTAVAAKS